MLCFSCHLFQGIVWFPFWFLWHWSSGSIFFKFLIYVDFPLPPCCWFPFLCQCQKRWRRNWQPTPGFLSGKIYEQRSLVGSLGSMGSQRVRHNCTAEHKHSSYIVLLHSSKYSKTYFVASHLIYHSEYSVCTWEECVFCCQIECLVCVCWVHLVSCMIQVQCSLDFLTAWPIPTDSVVV